MPKRHIWGWQILLPYTLFFFQNFQYIYSQTYTRVESIYNSPGTHHPALTIVNIFKNLFHLFPTLEKKSRQSLLKHIQGNMYHFTHNNFVCVSKLIRTFVFTPITLLSDLKININFSLSSNTQPLFNCHQLSPSVLLYTPCLHRHQCKVYPLHW